MIFSRSLLILALCAPMPGCALFQHRQKKSAAKAVEADAPAPRRIGTVSVVNGSFALVDTGTLYSPDAGIALKCIAADGQETAVLAVSPERRAPFIAADIVKGTPHAGDDVFQ